MITLFSICSICASASATDVILDGFVGAYSSFADSGLNIPITLGSCFPCNRLEVSVARQNVIACGVGLRAKTPFWLDPAFRLNFAQQRVKEKHSDVGGCASHNFREECHMSLEASSTTTFFWTDAGVELEIPRKSKGKRSSLVIGTGVSLIHAEDRIRAGSKYVYHYELWVHDPVHFSESTLKEFRHEERDIGGYCSSGFGLGCYVLLGFRFYISKAFSIAIETRTNFGTVELNSETVESAKELKFDSGTIGISCCYGL